MWDLIEFLVQILGESADLLDLIGVVVRYWRVICPLLGAGVVMYGLCMVCHSPVARVVGGVNIFAGFAGMGFWWQTGAGKR